MNKKKIIFDVILSITASAVPVFVLQLIILPLLARYIPDQNMYGLIITLIGVSSMISAAFGGALNNVRLLLNGRYEDTKTSGDFNPLVAISCISCVIFTSVCVVLYQGEIRIQSVLLITIFTIVSMLCSYYCVAFRLIINYKKILINSLIQTFGYFAGFVLFILTGYWELIYITGFVFSFFYIILNSSLISEPWNKTIFFKTTSYHMLVLIVASFLLNALTYIDRLILYPLLGGEAVSVYYVSTVFGKAISMIIAPISGVMLTYIAKLSEIKSATIFQTFFSSVAIGAVGYFVCIFISPFLLPILYPSMSANAMNYIYINTLTAVVNMVCTVMSPIILKFRSINWQIVIHILNLIIYLLAAVLLLRFYGLMGFCVGALISTVAKLLLMLTICFKQQPV